METANIADIAGCRRRLVQRTVRHFWLFIIGCICI
jgi:hypothetical protein